MKRRKRRDLRVGAVLREQNALPYRGAKSRGILAKAAIDNCRAGRAAKGASPFVLYKGALFAWRGRRKTRGNIMYYGFTRRARSTFVEKNANTDERGSPAEAPQSGNGRYPCPHYNRYTDLCLTKKHRSVRFLQENCRFLSRLY